MIREPKISKTQWAAAQGATDMRGVERNLWLLAEIAKLKRRVDLLEAYVRVLKFERERWESKHKGEVT